VAGHLDAAPLAHELAVRADEERRALDPADLLSVHVLHLDDAELLAELLVGVADEREREAHLRGEALVRLDRVARDAGDDRSRLREPVVQVAELRALGRAAGRVVLRVEVEHDRVPAVVGQRKRAGGRLGREIRNLLADHARCSS